MDEVARHVHAHSFSGAVLGEHAALVRYLLKVKAACARANEQAGDLSEAKARGIEEACSRLMESADAEALAERFPVDLLEGGGGIAINTCINQVLSEAAGAGVTEAECNRSQSTADVVASAYRCLLWETGQSLLGELGRTGEQLRRLADRFQGVTTISRTCLRAAMPVSMGVKLTGYAQVVEHREQGIGRAVDQLRRISLGTTVIGTGTGASAPYRAAVVDELRKRVDIPVERHGEVYAAVQSADELGALSHEVELLAQTLIKICSDLRLLSSGPNGGPGELRVPGVVKGSSFFEGKSNPTVIETMQQACFEALGGARVVSACLEHGELDLNTFEFHAAYRLYTTMRMVTAALENFRRHALGGLEVDGKRCGDLVRQLKEDRT